MKRDVNMYINNTKNAYLLLVAVLQAGLQDNFAEVEVSVVDCPDLTKEPFQFPVQGKSLKKAQVHSFPPVCSHSFTNVIH